MVLMGGDDLLGIVRIDSDGGFAEEVGLGRDGGDLGVGSFGRDYAATFVATLKAAAKEADLGWMRITAASQQWGSDRRGFRSSREE
jgi:hypothetical protein